MSDKRQDELKRNYEAFLELLPKLVPERKGKYALMKSGEIVDFFDTAADAVKAGNRLYPDKLFSVQEVLDHPTDLGFFSHAVPERSV